MFVRHPSKLLVKFPNALLYSAAEEPVSREAWDQAFAAARRVAAPNTEYMFVFSSRNPGGPLTAISPSSLGSLELNGINYFITDDTDVTPWREAGKSPMFCGNWVDTMEWEKDIPRPHVRRVRVHHHQPRGV